MWPARKLKLLGEYLGHKRETVRKHFEQTTRNTTQKEEEEEEEEEEEDFFQFPPVGKVLVYF